MTTNEPPPEVVCEMGIYRPDGDTETPLDRSEMSDFVSDAMDHLLADSRVTDPSVSASVAAGTVEFDFFMKDDVTGRDAFVQAFDIIYDMGRALGARWKNRKQVSDEPFEILRASTSPELSIRSQSVLFAPSEALVAA